MKPEQAAPHSKEILWRKALRRSVQPRMLSALLLSWWWEVEQQQSTGSVCSGWHLATQAFVGVQLIHF